MEKRKPLLLRNTYIEENKPNWLLHPIKRYKYNKWIKNLILISGVLENYKDFNKLALITDYNINNMEYSLFYDRNKSGDYIKARGHYVITTDTDFTNDNVYEAFVRIVLSGTLI